MPNILLGVTGSVAAIRTPALYAALREHGHDVKIVATPASGYFFDFASIDPANPAAPERNPERLILDEDEWPGLRAGRRWERSDPVLHIELRRWADLLLVAPLDANSLAKFANGHCDNCLTCVWRAWDPAKPIVLAPAMNTFMWQHPATRRHLRQLALDCGLRSLPAHFDETNLLAAINELGSHLRIVPPQVKTLACGDEGVGGIAEISDIVAAVSDRLLGQSRDDH